MESIKQKRARFRIIWASLLFIGGGCLVFSLVCYLQIAKPAIADPFSICHILIDPGHGGFDGGATGYSGSAEKDINLQISHKLRQLCQFFGYQTTMTRTQDQDIASLGARNEKKSDMQNRLKQIDQTPGTITVSIHQNKFSDRTCKGAQVFYGVRNEASQALAQSIQQSFQTRLQPNNTRQIKQAGSNLYLLYNAASPIVLVECGFLSNPDEEALLRTDHYQNKVAFTILSGILEGV